MVARGTGGGRVGTAPLTATSFTARLYQAGTGWVDVQVLGQTITLAGYGRFGRGNTGAA
jgi:hypothetical protein